MTRPRLNPYITVSAWLLSTSVQAVTLSLSPTTAVDPVIGQPFVVDLRASGLEGNASLGNYDLNINFETENFGLTTDGVVFGDQLQLSGVDSLSDVRISNGQVSLAEVSLNDAAILEAQQADSFTLATLNFTPNATGNTTLNITDATFGTQNGEELGVALPDAINVIVQPRKNTKINDLQRSTGVALRNVCSSLNVLEESQTSYGANEIDLQRIACQVYSTQDPNDLQNIAGEETFAPASLSIKTTTQQAQSIKTHLSNRRQGANGFNTQNLKFVHNGELLSLAALGLAGAIGGSAGDEDEGLGLSERLGGFINATAQFGEFDASSREDALNFNREEVLLGVDYRLTDQWIAGVAAGYTYYNANFQRLATVAGGSVKSDGYSGSVYSTYYIDDFYIDGLFSYTRGNNDVRRRILLNDNPNFQKVDRTAHSTSESDQYQTTLNIGTKFYQGGLTYNPYLRMTYLDLTIDSYTEKGAKGLNLKVAEQHVDSFETVLGGQISYAWSQSFAVLIPHIRAEWHHEFLENERTIKTRLIAAPLDPQNILSVRSDRPDRDFASLGVGVDAVFRNSISASLTYQTVLGQQNVESHAFTAGVRMAF